MRSQRSLNSYRKWTSFDARKDVSVQAHPPVQTLGVGEGRLFAWCRFWSRSRINLVVTLRVYYRDNLNNVV